MDKLNLVHPDNGIFFSTKKNCAVKSGKDMEEQKMLRAQVRLMTLNL